MVYFDDTRLINFLKTSNCCVVNKHANFSFGKEYLLKQPEKAFLQVGFGIASMVVFPLSVA